MKLSVPHISKSAKSPKQHSHSIQAKQEDGKTKVYLLWENSIWTHTDIQKSNYNKLPYRNLPLIRIM